MEQMPMAEIAARLREEERPSLYVLSGEQAGWHDFNDFDSAAKYVVECIAKGWEFVINPKW